MDAPTLAKTFKKYKESIKRSNEEIKKKRVTMREHADKLYKYMVSKDLKEYEGVKISEVKPKPKSAKVTKEMKKKVIFDYIAEHEDILKDPKEAIEIITSLYSKRNLESVQAKE